MTTALLTLVVPDGKDPAAYQAVAGDHLQEKGFEVRPATPADIRERVTLEGPDCVTYLKQAVKKVVEEAAQALYDIGEEPNEDDAIEWVTAYVGKNEDLDIVWSVEALLDNEQGIGTDSTEDLDRRIGESLARQVVRAWQKLEDAES